MPGCCPRLPQLNPDGTTRDFVDYDANTIAVAYGVATGARAAAVRGRPPPLLLLLPLPQWLLLPLPPPSCN